MIKQNSNKLNFESINSKRYFCFLWTNLAPIVTFHNKLVSSGNKTQPISMVKLCCYILTKCIPGTSRRYSPTTSIIWVRPQEITHWTLMRNLFKERLGLQINLIYLHHILHNIRMLDQYTNAYGCRYINI